MDSSSNLHSVPWRPIGQISNQLILYHPSSHALRVHPHPFIEARPLSNPTVAAPTVLSPSHTFRPLHLLEAKPRQVDDIPSDQFTCPYCLRPSNLSVPHLSSRLSGTEQIVTINFGDEGQSVPYFQALERAHELSRPSSPDSSGPPMVAGAMVNEEVNPLLPISEYEDDGIDEVDLPAGGYYQRFFREEGKLGAGAQGSVFLATHVIEGDDLGAYAVKKIAVGRSRSYLHKMLREVKLMEALRHPNVIAYHHSWIDMTRFSKFGPPVAALHVLMMYATAGNLDQYLSSRTNHLDTGRSTRSLGCETVNSSGQVGKHERIKAFKVRRRAKAGEKRGQIRDLGDHASVHTPETVFLVASEISKLFGGVVEGLAFLHANHILHLDLKCSNVLLHWEDNNTVPKAMLSDFGTSEGMEERHERTGYTGTMEYMAPETLVCDLAGRYRPSDSTADLWSLGMILHKILFLCLPYPDTADYNSLYQVITSYRGFVSTPELHQTLDQRGIPGELLRVLAKLVNIRPKERMSAEDVKLVLWGILNEGQLEHSKTYSRPDNDLVLDLDLLPHSAESETTGQTPFPRSPPYLRGFTKLMPFNRFVNRNILSPNTFSPPNRCQSNDKRGIAPQLLSISHAVRVTVLFLKILSLHPEVSPWEIPITSAMALLALSLTDVVFDFSAKTVIYTTTVHIGIFYLFRLYFCISV